MCQKYWQMVGSSQGSFINHVDRFLFLTSSTIYLCIRLSKVIIWQTPLPPQLGTYFMNAPHKTYRFCASSFKSLTSQIPSDMGRWPGASTSANDLGFSANHQLIHFVHNIDSHGSNWKYKENKRNKLKEHPKETDFGPCKQSP